MQPVLAAPSSQHGELRLSREGLVVGGRHVPLLSGSVHYFRIAPENWRRSLSAVQSLGLRLVDTYVPWAVHELAPGRFEFGRRDPRLHLARFLELAAELELLVILRPGPHVNAELTGFGVPERVLWDPRCQALSAGRKPVFLPAPPLAFPVPSYASLAFRAEARRWFEALGAELTRSCWPNGPVVLVQVDNEGTFYFRDGLFDQDYHPDAIAAYRAFLERKYGAGVRDPTPPESARDPLARRLDWAEFQEWLLADALASLRRDLRAAGFELPTMHNLPIAETATPLDPTLLAGAVDFLGLDYYYGASPFAREEIQRRTATLRLRSETRDVPAFACELGAGFPPFFPPLSAADNAFTALSALAYGLTGFNLYMAVDRDRWIGAPFTQHGERRPSADFWQRLLAALVRLRFGELTRETPVHVLVPRVQLRLARALHAFGPASQALFRALGHGALAACYEDDDDPAGAALTATELFRQHLEQALERRRIPFAVVSADLVAASLERARWLIVLCPGLLERELAQRLAGAEQAARMSFGPRPPLRDETLAPLELGLSPGQLLAGDPEALDAALARAEAELGLGRFPTEPLEVHSTLYRDAAGNPRVLFVINASARDVSARVDAAGADYALDALDGAYVRAKNEVLEVFVPARSARMLELRNLLSQAGDGRPC